MHRDDVVLVLEEGDVVVGAIDRFFEKDGEMIAQLSSYRVAAPRLWTDWVTTEPRRVFVQLSDIRANLKWARRNNSIIRVLLPPAIKLG